jgi:hypothetical protein
VTTGALWKYTAPLSGVYRVGWQIRYGNGLLWTYPAGYINISLYKNGGSDTAQDWVPTVTTTPNNGVGLSSSATIKLLAGDYIDLRTSHGETTSRSLITLGSLVKIYIERVGN